MQWPDGSAGKDAQVAKRLIEVVDELVAAVERLRFRAPVAHVYNPLVYARAMHLDYLRRYGRGSREVLLLGMNPGPFGMAQTGVPFGEVSMVRDWLGVRGAIGKPPREHPKRPIDGLDCSRAEVSGARLWGWARSRFGEPQRFFERFFVANYCPLVFLEASGRNLTPDRLPAGERAPLLAACDAALRRTVEILAPRMVVGIGKFAEQRAAAALDGLDVRIGGMLHPSPASPAANRGWEAVATRQLAALGIAC